MKYHFLLGVIGICAAASSYGQNGISFVVPSAFSNVDGNTYSFFGPACNQPGTIRHQQVYAASEFASLTNSAGGWVYSLRFRGDATNGTHIGLYMPSVQVNFSTTLRGPDELSATFSENVGTDDTVVFSKRLDTALTGGNGQGPEIFYFEILPLAKLFFYNPAEGNLLLDIRVFQGNTNAVGVIQMVFDAVVVTNDSVSRVWRGDVNATTGLVETIGLPTDITFWRNPKLTVQRQANSVVLTWPANLPGVVLPETVLESRLDLSLPGQWHAITSGIVTSNFVSSYTVSKDSAGGAAYFRLVSTTPP